MRNLSFISMGIAVFLMVGVCHGYADGGFSRSFDVPTESAVLKNAVEEKTDAVGAEELKPESEPESEPEPELEAESESELESEAESEPESELESEAEFPGLNDQWKDSWSADWIANEAEKHNAPRHFNNRAVLRGEQRVGHAYGRYSEADLRLWESETVRLVAEGARIFHSAEILGSTNGVSCDMCHPDGANTHAETYPKYQVQLGRPALLRDMMNWCLQNPCRGEPMSGDDPRMRAMEAYLNAVSSGKPMKYGKH